MQKAWRFATVLALVVLCAPYSLTAQETPADDEDRSAPAHVVTEDDLRAAATAEADRDAADRALLQRLLEREDVREIAGKAGLDVERAQEAVPQLDDEEVQRLAAMATDVEDQPAGGQTTITITSTAIIIALLVIILIMVA